METLVKLTILLPIISLALASLIFLFSASRIPIWGAISLALPLLFVLALSGSRSSGVYLFAILVLSLLLYWRGTACTEGVVAKRRLLIASFLQIIGFVFISVVRADKFVCLSYRDSNSSGANF